MKLEFNSIAEILDFLDTFQLKEYTAPEVKAPKIETVPVININPEPTKDPIAEIKDVVPAKINEWNKAKDPEPETKEPDPEVTKEMIRVRVTAIMEAGKGEEIRALITQHGYSSIPSIDVKDYAAIYEAAKGLL